jgi:hypothetical protein
MDKVKAQATQLADRGQEMAQLGHSKLDALQAKRASDTLLRELGAAVYAGATRGVPADRTAATVDKIVGKLRDVEEERGPIDLSDAAMTAQSPGQSPASSGAAGAAEDSSGEGGGSTKSGGPATDQTVA